MTTLAYCAHSYTVAAAYTVTAAFTVADSQTEFAVPDPDCSIINVNICQCTCTREHIQFAWVSPHLRLLVLHIVACFIC